MKKKNKIKIKDLVGDLTYEEIKERRWRIPRLWRNDKKLLFTNYLISYDGIVISAVNVGGSFVGKRKTLRKSYNGYVIVFLYLGGKQYSNIMLHRLLWETWIGKIPEKLQINHLDTIKANNFLSNFEVTNNSGNIKHAFDNGLISNKGKDNPFFGKKHTAKTKGKMGHARKNSAKVARHTKLTEKDVLEIRKLSNGGKSLKEIHKLYNELIGMKGVYYIIKRKTWIHV